MKKISMIILFIMLGFVASLGMSFSSNIVSAEQENIFIDQTNFVEVMSNSENYSKHLTLIEDIDFNDISNLNSIYSVSRNFTGVFDGNGFSIKNLSITSPNNNYGLFQTAENAVIKNLKIDGDIVFLFNQSLNLNVGALVGKADNVIIDNCQLSEAVKFITNEKFLINQSINLGGFVGASQDCNFSNCLTYAKMEVECYCDFQTSIKIGGIVGQQNGGNIKNSISVSQIQLNSDGLTDISNLVCAGVVGELVGGSSTVRNTMFIGEISSFNQEHLGAIVGKIFSLNSIPQGNIEYCYWTNETLPAISIDNGYSPLDEKNLCVVTQYGSDFFSNINNWYPLAESWDFDLIWLLKNSSIKLQRFEYFNFSLTETPNPYLKNITFSDGTKSTKVKFGQTVNINIEIADEYVGYYHLSYVNVDNVRTSNYKETKIKGKDDKILGYNIEVIASDITDGIYSFDFRAIRFQCEAVVQDKTQGGVKEKSGNESTDRLPLVLTYDSLPITIVAEAKGIYTFTQWELYYKNEANEWTIASLPFDSESKSIEVKFGVAPFDREFRLEAHFSSENAISVDFTTTRFEEGIKSILFSGCEYLGEGIKVSSTSRAINLRITMNAGYRLDTNAFVAFLTNYYGSTSTSTILRTTEESIPEAYYEFVINMNVVSQNISEKQFIIPLVLKQINLTNAKNLTWLYYTIPVIVILAVGGIVLFIILRRRRIEKKLEEKKNKDNHDINYYI